MSPRKPDTNTRRRISAACRWCPTSTEPYLRLYRVRDWLHFLPLPLAAHASPGTLAAGVAAWAFGLAYTSAINQAFDDRLDRDDKNPVGRIFGRRRAIFLSLIPLAGCLGTLAIFSRERFFAGATMMLAATLYSAPPRLKRFVVVGSLWNLVIGVPGFYFAGRPSPLLVGLFALLLLISQLLHEAHDLDDDQRGGVRTVATELGRRATLILSIVCAMATPLVALGHGAPMLGICAVFAVVCAALVALRKNDLAKLRLGYRWLAIVLGAIAFALSY